MSYDEQAVIERFFRHLGAVRTDVVLGIGDDAALLRAQLGCDLVQTTDALVEDVHFLPGSPPRSLGHRALAVNLSDLAAMGASPCWALLSLTLPQIDETWLGEFAAGFGVLARTPRGGAGGRQSEPRSAHRRPCSSAGRCRSARHCDAVERERATSSGSAARWAMRVSDARCHAETTARRARATGCAHGVSTRRRESRSARRCGAWPAPALILSDGLLADVPRLAAASGCGARLDRRPSCRFPTALRALGGESAWQHALAGGEDYELCLAAPPAQAAALEALAARLAVPLTAAASCAVGAGIGAAARRRRDPVLAFAASIILPLRTPTYCVGRGGFGTRITDRRRGVSVSSIALLIAHIPDRSRRWQFQQL